MNRLRQSDQQFGDFAKAAFELPSARNQRAAGGQLHSEVRHAFMLADLVDGQDRRMFQSGNRSDLQTKALPHFGGIELLWQQHLQRDNALGLQLLRAINDTHSAARYLVKDDMIVEPEKSIRQPWR